MNGQLARTSATVLLVCATSLPAKADNLFSADRALAAPCSGCHSREGLLPPLASRPASELRQALLDFRAGTRDGTLMTRIARGYTPAELERIARQLGRPEQ